MSKETIISLIHGFCEALVNRDVEKVLSFYANDATLSWGPYTFKGLREIKTWATELGENFGEVNLAETDLTVRGNKAVQKFGIKVSMPNGFKGTMSGIGEYEFDEGKIKKATINLSEGVAILTKSIELYFAKYQRKLMETPR